MNADSKESIVPFRLVGLSKYASKKDTIVDVSKDLKAYQEIIMNVGDKLLTVNYSLLDYQNRTHLYAYRIEGLDKDWIYMNEEVIRLSNLPYGKFKLRIKAQLESGSWNEEEIVIPINVIKPFYLETWFYISLFFLVVFIFLLIYKLRVNKLEKDKLRLESLVQKRTNSLYEALEDRELLLKEIHHRVKNNLQVISGLLQLQKDELQNEEAQAAINEGQSRVGSIALIHQNLYQNKDLGNIEFKTFLIDLTKQVADLYQNENRKIELNLNLDELFIDIDTAVPLGLILNELLTNTYKYAFVDTYQIKVDIKLIQTEKGKYQLTYKDNGPGLKENPDFENAKTLGINLIGGLAKQLSGTAVYEFDGGSKFIISLKDSKLRKQES
jgi:two-component sensor histidine kinase